MLAGASDEVEDTSTEELVVDVVAWAEETEDDIEDIVWAAEDADEELYQISLRIPIRMRRKIKLTYLSHPRLVVASYHLDTSQAARQS